MKRFFRSLVNFFRLILVFLLLPIYLTFQIFNPLGIVSEINNQKTKFWKIVSKKLASLFVLIIIVIPVWRLAYILSFQLISQKLGFSKEVILVSGTGSMYPTFPKGHGKDSAELSKEIVSTPGMFPYPNGLIIRGKRYFGYELQRGDVVVVENDRIKQITKSVYGVESGWVKRLIGLPGDTIELREGLVYLNKLPQKEKYTALPRSTFGETFLGECKEVKVPEDAIFVMGDNRKGSGDSREVGFISIESVNHVLPLSAQIGVLDHNWRNTDADLSDSAKIKLAKQEYLKLLNSKRKESGKPILEYNSKLEISAKLRGEKIIKYDDFSFEATRSGYTVDKALDEVGYSNIVWGEIPTQGYFEAEELIANQFEFPTSKEFLLSTDFDDIGIALVEGKINGCPTQVIVMHFGGYVPPNYKKEDIEAWKKLLASLKAVQPSWRDLKNFSDFYNSHRVEIDRLNAILEIRINNVSQLIATMEANRWFSESEKRMIGDEEMLTREQSELADKINSFN